MPNITLSIPEELYKKMKKHKEIKWSEIARKAISEYIDAIESYKSELSTDEFLTLLNDASSIKKIDASSAEEFYKRMRELEWKRIKRFSKQVH